MRFQIAALAFWLIVFYNVERLGGRVNMAGPIYVFVPVVVIITILIPRLCRVPLWAVTGIPVSVYLVLRALAGRRVWDTALPLIVTEVCIIALTAVLAYWVGTGVNEFERAVASITTGQDTRHREPSTGGQAEMYRELKRARRHNRPLALMAIGVEEESISVGLDRMVQEAQQAMMKHYVLSQISETLCDKLEDYSIVAQTEDRFWILLPETTPDGVSTMAEGLHKTVLERVGVVLRIGTASFPDDALTFDSLMEKAVSEMKREQASTPTLRSQQLAAEDHTT
jgi:GGDEF domain-containing protein